MNELPVLTVAIDQIEVDAEIQPREGGLDQEHIENLERVDEDKLPPLTVVAWGTRYKLIEGHHRLEVARRVGRGTVRVYLHPSSPGADLRSLAFDLNAGHGKPLTLADRRRHAAYLLVKDPLQTDYAIAKACGMDQKTIKAMRQSASTGFPVRQQSQNQSTPSRVSYPVQARHLTGELIELLRKAEESAKKIVGFGANVRANLIADVLPIPLENVDERMLQEWIKAINLHLQQNIDHRERLNVAGRNPHQ